MSPDALRECIKRVPFHPVTLFLPSGKKVIIDNPELTMFNETGRTLVIAQGERIILVDVATAEAVETAAD